MGGGQGRCPCGGRPSPAFRDGRIETGNRGLGPARDAAFQGGLFKVFEGKLIFALRSSFPPGITGLQSVKAYWSGLSYTEGPDPSGLEGSGDYLDSGVFGILQKKHELYIYTGK